MTGAAMEVTHHDDAAEVLARAGDFLAARPIEHNLVLGLLQQRAETGEAGRYWVVHDGTVPVGVVFQSPLAMRAAVTPMPPPAARAAAAAIAAAGFDLPGVDGEAATTSVFAGQWSESARTAAHPALGMRLSVLGRLTLPEGVPGRLRPATGDDPAVAQYFDGFRVEVGEEPIPPAAIARRVRAGQVALWEVDGRAVCLVGHTAPVAGVVRIGPVYTPPEERRHGYAAACTGAVSAGMVALGHTCMLFTDLANPTSNAVYRSLGYSAVGENVRYTFRAVPATKASP